MSLEFIYGPYLKYHLGNGMVCCHVDAVHAAPPKADVFTDNVVMGVINQTGCAGIISIVSREEADLNRIPDAQSRRAIQEYRTSIKEILNKLGVLDHEHYQLTAPYLHLAIHGMRDDRHGAYAIEIGTRNGQSCSNDMRNWFKETVSKKAHPILPKMEIVIDQYFTGNESIVFHRHGDGIDYHGYGRNYHAFQIEIARTLREDYRKEIIEILSHVILDFQNQFPV